MKFVSLPKPTVISTDEQFNLLMTSLSKYGGWDNRLALDTETTGLNKLNDIPIYWSMSDGKDRWLFSLEHLLSPAFHDLVNQPNRVWVLHNAKYDMHMLANVGVPEFKGTIADTLSMGFLYDENRQSRGELGLKYLANDLLGIAMKPFKEIFGVKSEADIAPKLISADVNLVARYATLDAFATWQLSEYLRQQLESSVVNDVGTHTDLFDYFMSVEAPFTKCLWRMERRGFKVDSQKLTDLRIPMEARMKEINADIFRAVGRPINIRSVKQLKEYFFGDASKGGLGLKPVKFTDTDEPSTDEESLTILASKGVVVAQMLLEYRKLDKLVGTYLIGLVEKIEKDGRIHGSINQTGTVTGRLSSSDPNLQNIPRKGDAGKEIRKAFVASEGYKLGVWDYGQIEMRVMAHMSADKAMCTAISDGLDLHCFTASRMLGYEYEDAVGAKVMDDADTPQDAIKGIMKKAKVNEERAFQIYEKLSKDPKLVPKLISARDASKAIGFGIMYGKGPGSLGEELGISRNEAQQKINAWFNTFPAVRDYIQHTQSTLINDPQHCVRTLMGRYRRLMSITSTNHGIKAKAERDSINAPIQGSAADITKMAMLAIDRDPMLGGDCLEGGTLGVRMLLQVHDELLVEAPNDESILQECNKRIVNHMCNAIALRVPLTAEGRFANSWAEAK